MNEVYLGYKISVHKKVKTKFATSALLWEEGLAYYQKIFHFQELLTDVTQWTMYHLVSQFYQNQHIISILVVRFSLYSHDFHVQWKLETIEFMKWCTPNMLIHGASVYLSNRLFSKWKCDSSLNMSDNVRIFVVTQ